ncbi:redoxin domain-containing protein [Egbenema bharatensis]|uniref:redoxin domain-containing protein n=1 Tax=Egbenema bharatensis TaxID=3463334 RepID=UPI003A8A7B9C
MHDPILTVGEVIPSFQLQAVNRNMAISPWHYKQRYNLVIFLFHHATCHACCELLLDLSQHYQTYRALDTEILAIATDQPANGIEPLQGFVDQHTIPFPILWDQQGQVSGIYLQGKPNSALVGVFICDRFGELYLRSVAAEANELPNEPEIRSWAEFIDMRCT